MNLYKSKNQINILKPKAKAKSLLWRSKNKKILSILAIAVCLSMVIVNLQVNLIKVSAQIIPVTVSINHLSFGAVFPGEQVQGSFIVSYAEESNGIDYWITQERKPLPPEHPEYPDGGDPEMPGYYKNLCPHLIKVSEEGEGDSEEYGAFVGPNDMSDTWTIYFEVPAIFDYVAQDHTGGVIDINGEYGCDISIDIDEPETSICGTKFYDNDLDGEKDAGEQGLAGWTINLFEKQEDIITLIASSTTDNNGNYCFDNIEAGNYILGEVLKDGWEATLPINPNPYYEFAISAGEQLIRNFGNYQPGPGPKPACGDGNLDPGEECDDNNTVSGDGCSSTCQTEGGGGGGDSSLALYDEQVSCVSETSVIVTWRTNKYATSRVVYGAESQISIGSFPYYGYLSSTDKDMNKVTVHSAVVENLDENTVYYFKPISGASPDVLGKELSFNMADCCEATEGAPELAISKTVNFKFANPGDAVIYKVSITNSGNLTAYNAILIDTLPAGFTFADGNETSKTWQLGNIESGQTKGAEYDVVIDSSADAGIYVNMAQVSADNHDPVSASVDLEVKKIKVLGIELAPTGFSVKEFIILVLALVMLVSSVVVLRKRYL